MPEKVVHQPTTSVPAYSEGEEGFEEGEAEKGKTEETPAEVEASPSHPLNYNVYQPIVYKEITKFDFMYWFYIYVQSSEVDRLFQPFEDLLSQFPKDRRLRRIMNFYGVRFVLKQLEMYRSLPRRVVMVQGNSWNEISTAIRHLEESFPELMQYSSHPNLIQIDTSHYASTHLFSTAMITRLTKPI